MSKFLSRKFLTTLITLIFAVIIQNKEITNVKDLQALFFTIGTIAVTTTVYVVTEGRIDLTRINRDIEFNSLIGYENPEYEDTATDIEKK